MARTGRIGVAAGGSDAVLANAGFLGSRKEAQTLARVESHVNRNGGSVNFVTISGVVALRAQAEAAILPTAIREKKEMPRET
jgi:hypothetical protein